MRIHFLFTLLFFSLFISSFCQYNTQNFSSDNGDGTFTNPLIKADYPDPDIIRVGSDFYMASSSFTCMPGVPICHSKDLINWKVIGHVYDSLTGRYEYTMEHGKVAYRGGTWAPTIRYHKGKFYVGVNSPQDGFSMYIADKPEGPYEIHRFGGVQLYDPGLFFDDNDRVFVVHGANIILITELSEDATRIKDSASRLHPSIYGSPLEGSHVYKKNGFYYIFNTSHGYNGIEVVYRSKNIYGPYESRLLFSDAINYADAGSHQGGYVELENGDSWFFMFQDRDYLGRVPMLQPMTWKDNWPIVGDSAGKYKLVTTYKKPNTGAPQPLAFPQGSDEFNAKTLAPIWEFNHSPDNSHWSLTNHPGQFEITASEAPDFWHARNTLTQKIAGFASSATVKVDVKDLKNGDFGGIGIFGYPYTLIGVTKQGSKEEIKVSRMDTIEGSAEVSGDVFYLRTNITDSGTALFSYSLDNKTFTPLGNELVLAFTVKTFLGNRFGLFCYHSKSDGGGSIRYDWFHLEGPKQRGNHFDGYETVPTLLYDDQHGLRPSRSIPKRPMGYVSVINRGEWLQFNHIDFKGGADSIVLTVATEVKDAIIEVHENSFDGPLLDSCPIKATGDADNWEEQTFAIKRLVGDKKICFVYKNATIGLVRFKSFRLIGSNVSEPVEKKGVQRPIRKLKK